MRGPLLALALVGCKASSYDRVDEACDWRGHVDRWGVIEFQGFRLASGELVDVLANTPTYPSLHCLDVAAEEMRFDIADFEAKSPDMDDGRENLLVGLTIDGASEPLMMVANGVRTPFLLDLGDVRDLTPSRMISPSFVDDMEREAEITGEHELGRLLYSFVERRTAGGIRVRELTNDAFMSYNQKTETISIDEHDPSTRYSVSTFASLVHEARHLEGGGHTEVTDRLMVDLDDAGAYAYGLAVHTLLYRYIDRTDGGVFHGDLERLKESMREGAYWDIRHIATFLDDDFDVLPEYQGLDDGAHDELFWE
jgi:hypothetical protein